MAFPITPRAFTGRSATFPFIPMERAHGAELVGFFDAPGEEFLRRRIFDQVFSTVQAQGDNGSWASVVRDWVISLRHLPGKPDRAQSPFCKNCWNTWKHTLTPSRRRLLRGVRSSLTAWWSRRWENPRIAKLTVKRRTWTT